VGLVQHPKPVLLICAAFSRHPDALQWGLARAENHWGPVHAVSDPFPLTETNYYDQEMGPDQAKQFWAFQSLRSPEELPDWKLTTNQWEIDYAKTETHAEQRPLNLDPGYLTEAKLLLATTKDRDHRIYLRDGIYAEVTLHFRQKQWTGRPWTYPDYLREEYHAFFDLCRRYLRDTLRTV